MRVQLLKRGYLNNEEIYDDFLNDKIDKNNNYFSNETVYISEAPDFPIYIADRNKKSREKKFLQAFKVITNNYLNLDRDLTFNGVFWHSLLITKKRNYILENYPQVTEGYNRFKNIVFKTFDWENYIYKCLIGAQYIFDNINDEIERKRYFKLIINNLDLYNYIIKYPIFRNDHFLINVLDIIDELNLSDLLKKYITGRKDLGEDERYGRRVIFELNKSYPIVLSPMLDKKNLKRLFLKYLGYYYDLSLLESQSDMETFTTIEN